ncbi:hypothetical protein MKX08_010100 [Trichoderma sp. CBMAI-0020]|nr:hypothetical protein MKX08_010100 [Trichoderma sp. CBMAI-0020]WOD46395.1 hypothetical protein [Trichoderma atroviride]
MVSTMRNALISFAVVALGSQLCVATPYPNMQYDPATTKDCVDWISNTGGKTCKEVRDSFNLTPEEFAQWNPSVGVNCDKLWIVASYCVLTHQKLSQLTSTTASITKPVTTATVISTTALQPSPTAWEELGCYADRPNRPILDKLVSDKRGDAALTIPKCQDTCYRLNYQYAGVKTGNQCWCSGFVAGERAPHTTDCNMGCTGDTRKNCGGQDCLNVFKSAKQDSIPGQTTSTGIKNTASSTQGASTTSNRIAGAAQSSKASSGAARNFALMWMNVVVSGLIFRVSNPGRGADAYRSYYVGISGEKGGSITLNRADNNWKQLSKVKADIQSGKKYVVMVEAAGDIFVNLNTRSDRRITVQDGTFRGGSCSGRLSDRRNAAASIAATGFTAKADLNTSFKDFTVDVDVTLTSTDGNAGIMTPPPTSVTLGGAKNSWTELKNAKVDIQPNKIHQ